MTNEVQELVQSLNGGNHLDHSKINYVLDLEADADMVQLTIEERNRVIERAIHKATRDKRTQLKRAQNSAAVAQRARREAKKLDSYDYFKRIAHQAELKFGKFNADSQNREVIGDLMLYFSEDKRFEERGYSLKKGLMVFGDVGCGKTSLMKFLRVNQVQSYQVVNCADIALEFVEKGPEGLKKYCNYLFDCSSDARIEFHQTHCGICFDDLGTESASKNYGNTVDVMGTILGHWYNKGRFNHIHITTNLTADQLKEAYGERLVSRMHEMFNIIQFPEGAKDRR